MALLFLDDVKEASRFATSSKDAYVRITPNHSHKDSAIWGIDSRCMYFGYGNHEEDDIEKVLYIDNSKIGIGTDSIDAKLVVIEPSHDNLNALVHVMNIQNALYVDSKGTVSIRKTQNDSDSDSGIEKCKNCFEVETPVYISGDALFQSKEVRINGDSAIIQSKMITVGSILSETSLFGNVTFYQPTQYKNTVEFLEPIFVQKDITLNGNLYMLSDGYADSWTLKNKLTAKSISTQQITCYGQGLCVKGGEISLDGIVSIGETSSTNILSKDVVYISKSIELAYDNTSKKGIGIGKKPSVSIDTVGDISADGHLTIKKQMTIGTSDSQGLSLKHILYGNVSISGKEHSIKGNQLIDGSVVITKTCTIGEEHRPGLLHIYGPVHTRGIMYVHNDMYIDNNLSVSGAIRLQSIVDSKEPVLQLTSGSVSLHKGSIHINTSIITNDALYVCGNTSCIGDMVIKGSQNIQKNVRVEDTLYVGNNNYIQNDLHVSGNADINGELRVKNKGIFASTVELQKELHVAENAYIGTSGKESLLSINGSCKASTSIETPSVHTQSLNLHGSMQINHKRYGLRQSSPIDKYLFMKFIYIPYRRGLINFYVRVKGNFYTNNSSMSVTLEFGGNTGNPNHKIVHINGAILNDNGVDITKQIRITIYKTRQSDYVGCIYIPSYIQVGYELDIEIDGRYDIFQYAPIDITVPKVEEWVIWWECIKTAHIIETNDTVQVYRKLGIGEDNPIYMLDVRANARFQDKIYQPYHPDKNKGGLLQELPESIPCIQHNDTKYYAISDVLGWLVTAVKELQSTSK